MKKTLIALAIAGFTWCGAGAQTSQISVCGVKQDKVCRLSAGNKSVICYKTKYAENFQVCKNQYGYYICCETPNAANSTFAWNEINNQRDRRNEYTYEEKGRANNNNAVDMKIPQSQSYVMTSSSSIADNYPKRGEIKVCYVGNNVAENNRAPYNGCPSPASDGPELNRYRNMNVSNPVNLPPITGRSEE